MQCRDIIFSNVLWVNLLIFTCCSSSFAMAQGDIEKEVMSLVKGGLTTTKMNKFLEGTCTIINEENRLELEKNHPRIYGHFEKAVDLKKEICEGQKKGILDESSKFLIKIETVLIQFFSKSKIEDLMKIVKEIEKKSMKEMRENGKKKFDEEEQKIGAILRKITREIAGERGEKLASARGKEIFDWAMGIPGENGGLMPSVLFGRLQQLWHILMEKPAKVKGVRNNVIAAGSPIHPVHRKMIQVLRRKKRQDDFGMMVIIVLACMFAIVLGIPSLVAMLNIMAKLMAGLFHAGGLMIGLFILFCFLFYGGGGGGRG